MFCPQHIIIFSESMKSFAGLVKSMSRFYLFIICLLLFCPSSVSAKEPVRTIEGVVTKVSDGDTIQVTDNLGIMVKIRLYGIDAPETSKRNKKTDQISKPGQPYGEEAYQALRQKVKLKEVRCDVYDIDKYRRLVAIVWLDGHDINWEMIAEGHAWAYRKYLRGTIARDYIVAEEQAHRARKGLWQQENPQAPYVFRKIKRESEGW